MRKHLFPAISHDFIPMNMNLNASLSICYIMNKKQINLTT